MTAILCSKFLPTIFLKVTHSSMLFHKGRVLWQLWQHRRHLLHALLLAEMAWDKPWPHSKHGSSIQTCLILSQTPISHHVYTYPLVIKHGLRENPPFIDEFPIKNTFIGFWIVWLPESTYVLFEPCGMLFYPPDPALRPTSATGPRLTWGKDRLICSKLACNRSSYMGSMEFNGYKWAICGMVIPW